MGQVDEGATVERLLLFKNAVHYSELAREPVVSVHQQREGEPALVVHEEGLSLMHAASARLTAFA